jgi:uncharacterized protein (TIGR03085 family)
MGESGAAYSELFDASSGPPIAMVERAAICDLFEAVGPAAPTLCEGWDTHHLVAHLRGRESANLLRVFASAIPRVGDPSVDNIVSHHDYASLVDGLRHGPPKLSLYRVSKLDPLLNGLEFFIHHEDVRRAAPAWEPRVLPRWAQDEIWARTVGGAKMTQWRAPTAVVLERSDAEGSAQVSKGDQAVVVRGLPSEITLYLSGRRDASRVELLGPSDSIAAYLSRR